MDMHDANHVKAIVQGMLSRQGVPRWAIITTVNPNDATAKCQIMPDMLEPGSVTGNPQETGWLPVLSIAAGPVNVVALPTKGDQVLVLPDCGDMEHGIIVSAAHNTQDRPPISPATGKPAQSGEVLITLASGLYFHMTGDTIYTGGGNLVHDGNISASGNVTAHAQAGAIDLVGHDHKVFDVQVGQATITTTAPVAGT